MMKSYDELYQRVDGLLQRCLGPGAGTSGSLGLQNEMEFLYIEQMYLCDYLQSLAQESDKYESVFAELARKYEVRRTPGRFLEKMFVYFAGLLYTQGPGSVQSS
jgi:hypothetical protein